MDGGGGGGGSVRVGDNGNRGSIDPSVAAEAVKGYVGNASASNTSAF